jgi:hypothetical protein
MSSNVSLELSQVDCIAQLCDFLAHPGMQAALDHSLPVSMPHDVGSLGFDAPLWVGLGIVGLWSALDAFAERAGIPITKCAACEGQRSASVFRMAQSPLSNPRDVVLPRRLAST